MMTIRLHPGAHKTATTYLQDILLANRERLGARGVKLSAPQDVRRGGWMDGFDKARKALCETGRIPDDLAAPLRAWAPEEGDWILTEENIIGKPADLMFTKRLYPHAGKRLETLRALFPQARFKLCFSIRSYDGFYPSLYSEVVRNYGFVPFEKFHDPSEFARHNWADVIDAMAAHLPEENIVLWRFEDFRSVLPQALEAITGDSDDAGPTADYPTEKKRPSLSRKTLDVLADLVPAIGAKEARRLTETINDHYHVNKGYAPFTPFDEATARAMRDAYDAHVETIRTRRPGIRFLHPLNRGRSMGQPSESVAPPS